MRIQTERSPCFSYFIRCSVSAAVFVSEARRIGAARIFEHHVKGRPATIWTENDAAEQSDDELSEDTKWLVSGWREVTALPLAVVFATLLCRRIEQLRAARNRKDRLLEASSMLEAATGALVTLTDESVVTEMRPTKEKIVEVMMKEAKMITLKTSLPGKRRLWLWY